MRAMKRPISVLLSLMLVLGMLTIGMSAVSAAETKSIAVTSNIGVSSDAQYSDTSEQVTVTFKLKSDLTIVATQAVMTFDTTVLKVASTNTAATVMPNFSGAVVNLTKTDGRIPMNWTNYQGNEAFKDTEAVYATVVFDIIKKGTDTTVNLQVDDLTGSTDPAAGVVNDVKIIDSFEEICDTTHFTASVDEKVTPDEPAVDPGVFVYNVGIALDGKIGLNYYFYKNPVGYEGKTITVEFDGPSDADQNITSNINAFEEVTRGGVTYYKHTYLTYSTMMSQPVNVKISVDGQYVTTHTISIMQWVDDRLAGYEASDPEVAKLVKDMLNYGAAAQVFFTAYTDQLANAHINYALVKITANDITVPAGLGVAPDLSNIGMNWVRSAVSLDSGAPIRLLVDVTNETLFNANKTVACSDGKNYTFAPSGTRQAVTTDDVVSNEYDRVFEFTFANNAVYKTSINAFLKNLLTNYPSDEDYVNLCSALYAYGQSAKAIFG